MTDEDPYVDSNGVLLNKLGNGRTQRVFLAQLSRDAGWRIAWSQLDGRKNDAASSAGLQGDERPLADLLESLVRPL